MNNIQKIKYIDIKKKYLHKLNKLLGGSNFSTSNINLSSADTDIDSNYSQKIKTENNITSQSLLNNDEIGPAIKDDKNNNDEMEAAKDDKNNNDEIGPATKDDDEIEAATEDDDEIEAATEDDDDDEDMEVIKSSIKELEDVRNKLKQLHFEYEEDKEELENEKIEIKKN